MSSLACAVATWTNEWPKLCLNVLVRKLGSHMRWCCFREVTNFTNRWTRFDRDSTALVLLHKSTSDSHYPLKRRRRGDSISHVCRMQRECLLQIALIKAAKLPPTDLLSKIDAYVKVKVSTVRQARTAQGWQYSADAAVHLRDSAYCCSISVCRSMGLLSVRPM
jgi:hypothetical protein